MTYVIIGLVGVLAIVPVFRLLSAISKRLNRLTAAEVADKIERHIQGTEGPWDWDHFTSVPIADDRLDAIRVRCVALDYSLPEERIHEMRGMVQRLRNERG
jgi:hypothetical protein